MTDFATFDNQPNPFEAILKRARNAPDETQTEDLDDEDITLHVTYSHSAGEPPTYEVLIETDDDQHVLIMRSSEFENDIVPWGILLEFVEGYLT